MNEDNVKEKSLFDIFNNMDFFEENLKNDIEDFTSFSKDDTIKIAGILTYFGKNVKKCESLKSAVQAAAKAQTQWESTTCSDRAKMLYNIGKALSEKSKLLVPQYFKENEFSVLVDYFDFYSDLAIFYKEYTTCSLAPIGIILVVLCEESPLYFFNATIAAALAAGCAVIVQSSQQKSWFPLFLADILSQVGLLNGLYNVVTTENNEFISDKIAKVVFCGPHSAAQNFYKNNLSLSFNFMKPNKTSAIILDSCDLSAVVNKIFTETWGSKTDNMWTVSTVVVQESIFQKFLEMMKFRMAHLNSEKFSLKFKDKTLLDKINKITSEATKFGAVVERTSRNDNEWGPTVIVHYQDNVEPDLPILKVLICRTAKEGVTLLNNTSPSFGTSIWTEVQSEGLEIASMLSCKNIWINCHGVIAANIPFQASGSCVLGGSDGIYEYLSIKSNISLPSINSNEEREDFMDKLSVLQIAVASQNAFNKWQVEKNKKSCLKNIANLIKDEKKIFKEEKGNFSEIINYYAHLGNMIHSLESNFTQEFYAIQKKVPIGVIAVLVNNPITSIIHFITLITTPAIALGNAVVLVLAEKDSTVELLVKCFNRILPKNLLQLIFGLKAVTLLASDPTVDALWLCSENFTQENLQMIKNHAVSTLKHIWVIPQDISASQHLFQKECLRNKVIWLTKLDQFF